MIRNTAYRGLCLLVLLAAHALQAQDAEPKMQVAEPQMLDTAPKLLDTAGWPAAVEARSSLPSQRSYEYEFSDIEIAQVEKWLSWVGVEIPVDVGGKLSGWIWAQRSQQGWFSFEDYRIEGQFNSADLGIENWRFAEATLRFGYRNGTWYVGKLAGEFSAENLAESIGSANFAAELPLAEPRQLRLSGKVVDVELASLLQALGVDVQVANDASSLVLAAEVPLAQASDPASWNVQAELEVLNARSAEIPRSSLNAVINAQKGQWRINDGRLLLIDQPIALDGQGSLTEELAFEASLDGRQLDVRQLLRAGKLSSLASRTEGRIDVVGAIRGNAQRGLAAASVATRARTLQIDDAILSDVLIEGVLDNRQADQESLQLQIQSARVAGGTVRGTVGWTSKTSLQGLLPDVANLEFESLALDQLPRAFTPVALAGITTGNVQFQMRHMEEAEKEQKQNLALNWSGNGRMQVVGLSIGGVDLRDAELTITKTQAEPEVVARLQAADNSILATFTADTAEITGAGAAGESGLLAVKDFRAVGAVENFQTQFALNANKTLPVTLTGRFDVLGTPLDGVTSGQAEVSELAVTLGQQNVQLSDLLVTVTEQAYRLERFRLRDLDGRIAGSALVRRNGDGPHLLNLRVANVAIEEYTQQFAPEFLHPIAARFNAELRLQKQPDSLDLRTGWSGTVAGELADVKYQEIPLGNVAVAGEIQEQHASISALGSILGGDLKLDANVPLPTAAEFTSPRFTASEFAPSEFAGSLSGVSLQRAMSLIYGSRLASGYHGSANIEIRGEPDASRKTSWKIRTDVPDFRFQRQELARDLSADIGYRDGQFDIESLSGRLAGGRVQASGGVRVGQSSPTGSMQFSLQRLQLAGLLAILAPEYTDAVSGNVSYRGRAQLGRDFTLVGAVRVEDAAALALPVQSVRSDLQIKIATNGKFEQLALRNMSGTVLGGRLSGEAVLRGGSSFSLESQLGLSNAKLDRLGRTLGFGHIVGTGQFDAFANLRSDDVLDVVALQGPVRIEFENGDAQSVPILSDLARLVPGLQLASTDIRRGTMNAQIGQGQLRIRDLVLNSDAFWLVADGSASLTGGRLDLNALLQTGGGLEQEVTQEVSQDLLALALPQLALISEINDYLRNRTLYFQVIGTSKHPVIQLKPAQIAAKAFLQNFRRRLLAIPTVVAADAD